MGTDEPVSIKSINTWLAQGIKEFQEGQHEEAEVSFRRALAQAPRDPEILNNIGAVLYAQKKYRQAEKFLRAAIRVKPDYLAAYGNLAQLYLVRDQKDKVVRVLERYLAQRPVTSPGLRRVHRPAWQGGEFESFEREAQFILGNLYVSLKKWPKAIKHLEEVIKNYPENMAAQNCLGLAYFNTRNFEKAKAIWRRVIKQDETNADAALALALLYQREQQHRRALECFELCLKMEPTWPEALNYWGVSLCHLQRLKEAESAFKQALTFKPDYIEAGVNLATLYQSQGLLPQALNQLRKSLSTAGNPAPIRTQIAEIERLLASCFSAGSS